METGRGKKGKKAGWHLNLGLKEAVFAGIGVVGLMMISFTLGTLAGRGDIYRAAYSWGLMAPEAKPAAQITPPVALAPPAPTAAAAPAAAPAAAGAPPVATASAAPPHSAQAPHPKPVTGSVASLPPPAATASSKKKAKAAARAQEQKAKEDQLHRERQAVAKKMTFLNSFDSTSKPGLKKDKATKPQATQVKVATYRDGKTAKARMAELQKKGIKVSLKQGKDDKGATYTLYRQAPAPPKEGENLAKKKEKAGSSGSKPKPRTE